jgi:hypothetical protein
MAEVEGIGRLAGANSKELTIGNMKHRLYIDEVGNSDLGSSQNPNQRYLSLTGVIVELGYVDDSMFPEMESVKRKFFNSHPDDPIVFHRKELVNRESPFSALRTQKVEKAFNAEILGCLQKWKYTVITAVVDKHQLIEQYQVWRYDPYHYCLKILVERYVRWLQRYNTEGDVMAESRGGREDIRLKKSFENVYAEGSDWVTPELIQLHLTSSQLKVKPKANNIAGLQLADLIAHPSYKVALARRNREALPDNFGGQIGQILLDSKYYRSPSGRIDGWGIKWLP